MKLGRTPITCLCTLALAIGCGGESHVDGEEDAAIVFDATFPDAGTDAGPPPSSVGTRCESDDECAAGGPDYYCEPNLGGYCTTSCDETIACPMGSTCVQLGRGLNVCIAECDPTAEGDQCPDGNGCSPGGSGLPPVCLPGCEADAECGDGNECVVGGGDFGSGLCVDPDAQLGGACTSSADCPLNADCVTSADYPGGTCVVSGCDPNSNTGCPNDAQCLPSGFGGGACWDGCSADADCRTDWECVELVTGRKTCNPVFVPANLGQVCAGSGSCEGGTCIDEGFNGFPGSYCAAGTCEPSATDPDCPGDGVCAPTTDGGGLCVDGCAVDADCRDGYGCRPVDRDVPDGPKACLPACTDDSQCTATTRGGTPYVCNPGTGRCARPLDPEELGDVCSPDDFRDCRGGRCLGAAEGWPGGMCTYPGCSLSGASPSATCPSGSVCTDDGAGDPDLGVCVPRCTVGEADACRSGYECVAVGDGSADGACRPAS